MNFDNAKENIQPLASGREVKYLETALNAESNSEEAQTELARQKSEFESAIFEYSGNDPLSAWFEYITWIEQCFPKSGKGSPIYELIEKCLKHFNADTKYFQDRRFIKLYIKYIDSQTNPVDLYMELYNAGIGTMVADFYICWAHYFDIADNFNKANEIFNKGKDARAQPLEELMQAHTAFSLSIPDRIMTEDENIKSKFLSDMEEKRRALTSLKAYKHKHVGSIRTGNSIKSTNPGKLSIAGLSSQKKQKKNIQTCIFKDDKDDKINQNVSTSSHETSVIHSIIDKARYQENKKEPGPWSKPKSHNKRDVVHGEFSKDLGFSILEDSEENEQPEETHELAQSELSKIADNFGIKLPKGFAKQNLPQEPFIIPLKVIKRDQNSLPCYDIIFLNPTIDRDFSLEELQAYTYFKKNDIKNKFTEKYDKYWCNTTFNKIRLYPTFSKHNLPQSDFETGKINFQLRPDERFVIKKSYQDENDSYTIEDGLKKKYYEKNKISNTNLMEMSIDETIFNQSIETETDGVLICSSENISPIQPQPSTSSRNCGFNIFVDNHDNQKMTSSVFEIENRKLEKPMRLAKNKISSANLVSNIFVDNNEAKKIFNQTPEKQTLDLKLQQNDFSENIGNNESKEIVDAKIEKLIVKAQPKEKTKTLFETEICLPISFEVFVDEDLNTIPTTIIPQTFETESKNVFLIPDIPPLKNQQTENLFQSNSTITSETGFLDDDITCSTQNFNFFVKSKVASTPLKRKASNNGLFEQELGEEQYKPHILSPQPDENILSPHGTKSTVKVYCEPSVSINKQLSVILETSETGTTNTKSSVEDHTIPEYLTHRSTKCTYNTENLSVIPENSATKSILEPRQISSPPSPSTVFQQLKFVEDSETFSNVMKNQFNDYSYNNYLDHFSKTPEKLIANDSKSKVDKQIIYKSTNDSLTIPSLKEYATLTKTAKPNISLQKSNCNNSIFENSLLLLNEYKPNFPEGSRTLSECTKNTEKIHIQLDAKAINASKINSSTTIPDFKDIFLQNTIKANLSSTKVIFESNADQNNKASFVPSNINTNISDHEKSNVKLVSFITSTNNLPPITKDEDSIKQLSNQYNDVDALLMNFSERNSKIFVKEEPKTKLDTSDNIIEILEDDHDDLNLLGRSIYAPQNKDNKIESILEWEEMHNNPDNTFLHQTIDLNQTKQNISNFCALTNSAINPNDSELCLEFLKEIDFFNILETSSNCELVNYVPQIAKTKFFKIHEEHFTSFEYIAHGAFGRIYKGKHTNSKNVVALKQEKPPNFWEYYISLIIKERINSEMLPAFLTHDFALIGNNATILISEYISHGNLIDVCNHIYKISKRNIDEYIVMLFTIEIFSIMDHLHSVNIIHGDIKPDNFLLMRSKISLDNTKPLLKLIDFGNSIDMTRFPADTCFNVQITKTEDFICTEMIDGRPWTYQPDLFCIAGTIHVLLFGHYMKTEKKCNRVQIKTKLPRYFHKNVWNKIFSELLNVPDCKKLPNLQNCKLELKEIIAEKEKYVRDKINEFNRYMSLK